MAGVKSVRGGFLLGPACTLDFYSSSNCAGPIAHTINTGATSGSCLAAPQSQGYLSMHASCSGSTSKRSHSRDMSVELEKRAGPDGVAIFNDERFWNIQTGNGHRQDFFDFLEIDNVEPEGDPMNVDNSATNGALAEESSRTVMSHANESPNSDIATGASDLLNGWRVTTSIVTIPFTDANNVQTTFTMGAAARAVGTERLSLIIIDSAVAARNFQRSQIAFGLRFRTPTLDSNGNVAAVVVIAFSRD
ncbi:uncharacterized protein Z520_01389 [Fonsecaea multimorphosa CBS 102226]|uniref:Uncharacterized protein n=1 Tax=Fonsecaea multimorphosa CBS 102226 TaxID=1442371 RepID=A0A0D2L1M8_9EURO|nr:uncharacterized protein Z520_01389 [Fonsecaea multimorphosa CBS 102226]KIY02924.1 hypothetical protein Z520_01389 [Fonsecaea multimorphosa CBS 102226]